MDKQDIIFFIAVLAVVTVFSSTIIYALHLEYKLNLACIEAGKSLVSGSCVNLETKQGGS